MVEKPCDRIAFAALFVLFLAGLVSTDGAAAEEVTGVRWCPLSDDCLQWTPVAGVPVYYLFRGETGTDQCLLSPLIDSCNRGLFPEPLTGLVKLSEEPSSGHLFWYLVTTGEPTGNAGPAGSASPGVRELNTMRFLCEPGCSNMGESCSRSTDCCNAECVDGSCAAACGADALGVSMVKSWFDKPIHENIASPSHLFLDAYDLRRKRLYDLDQRLINHDGDPSTPALGASHPAWLYYRQGLLAPGSPADDGDANHALTFFQTPYRGSTITGFLGTEDGPDMIISEDSPSLEVRDFLAAINDGVVEHTDWLGRIQSIEIHEPPYLQVQGVWQPQGIATIKVTAATSGPSPAGGVRVTEAVLDAVPFPAATGPLHSCGGIEVAGSFSMHWGPVTALEDLYVLPANADGRWDSSIPWDTPYSHVPLGVPWDASGTYSDDLDGEEIEDPWFSLRTSGQMPDAPDPPLNGGTVMQPFGFPYVTTWPSYDKDRDHSNLIQLDPSVTCPDAPYLFWKELANTGGEDSHYLQWVTRDIFREGTMERTFHDWTHEQSGLFFFDTTNEHEPDGTNLTPAIVINGTWYSEGLVYLNAQNFRAVGMNGKDIGLIPPGEPFNDRYVGGPGYTGVYNAEPFDDTNGNDIWDPGEPFQDTIPPANGGTIGAYDADPWVNLQYDTSSAGHRIDHTVRLLPGTETFAVSSDPQGLVSGTTSNAWDRTGLPVLEEVNFLGIFFTNGALSMQGNGVSFGSAITKSGANETFFGAPAAGSTTVFFDQRLARGEWPPLRLRLPRVIITSWSWE